MSNDPNLPGYMPISDKEKDELMNKLLESYKLPPNFPGNAGKNRAKRLRKKRKK